MLKTICSTWGINLIDDDPERTGKLIMILKATMVDRIMTHANWLGAEEAQRSKMLTEWLAASLDPSGSMPADAANVDTSTPANVTKASDVNAAPEPTNQPAAKKKAKRKRTTERSKDSEDRPYARPLGKSFRRNKA